MIFKTSNLSSFFSNLKDGTAFQIKFKDRVGAGIALANALKFAVKRNKKGEEKILVLGIPRGGAIVADIVAQKMDAEFDIIMAKKLSAPDNKENAIGAVAHDGSLYLDDFLVKSLKIPSEYIEKEKKDRLKEIEDKIALYKPLFSSSTPPSSSSVPSGASTRYPLIQPTIRDRIVILVDDGLALVSLAIAWKHANLGFHPAQYFKNMAVSSSVQISLALMELLDPFFDTKVKPLRTGGNWSLESLFLRCSGLRCGYATHLKNLEITIAR